MVRNTHLYLLSCVFAGIASGCLSWTLSKSLYKVEDVFSKLPIYWKWWPAIGAIAIGAVLALLLCKSIMWVIALGSGTSWGVLDPLWRKRN